MMFDDEVLAVLLAIITVASVIGAVQVMRPGVVEPFTAIGLLNQYCMIGDYPKKAIPGENITLCIFVSNYEGRPIYYKVVFRVGTNMTIPSNSTPSPEQSLGMWRGVLSHGENTTFIVSVAIPKWFNGSRAALIFELWIYNTTARGWQYTGRWVHLYVDVVKPGV